MVRPHIFGHGYRTYNFFEQCQHRLACAKCDFYMPKDSTAALLLEGKTHLLRFLQEIPLGEAEQAVGEDGIAAYENLLLEIVRRAHPGRANAASDRRASASHVR